MYFTSSAIYSLLYIKPQSPALILCWVLTGSIYPITEHPAGLDSVSGKALEGGFVCHVFPSFLKKFRILIMY